VADPVAVSLWDISERILLGLVSLLVYIWGRERKALEDKITDLRNEFDEFRTEMNARLNRAGEKTSDLSTAVQGIPERLRREWREDMDRERR